MTRLKSLLGAVLALALFSQCRAGQHYVFQGFVYDGVTRQKLTAYTIEMDFGTQTVKGKVDATGRYTLEGLMDKMDYTVRINAENHRAFESYNSAENASDSYFQPIYFYRNAFVFPNDAQSPAYTMPVRLADSDQLPSGRVQFVPNRGTTSVLSDEGDFRNDLDTSTGVVLVDFANGVIDVAAGALLFGVEYRITVFGVANYSYTAGQNFVAGLDPATALTLNRLDAATEALKVVFMSNTNGSISAKPGTLTIVFNQPIELAPNTDAEAARRGIEGDLQIFRQLKDLNGVRGATGVGGTADELKKENTAQNAYGAAFTIDGSKITVTSAGDGALSRQDPATTLCKVVFKKLDGIKIRAKTATGTAPALVLTDTDLTSNTGFSIAANETVEVAALNGTCLEVTEEQP